MTDANTTCGVFRNELAAAATSASFLARVLKIDAVTPARRRPVPVSAPGHVNVRTAANKAQEDGDEDGDGDGDGGGGGPAYSPCFSVNLRCPGARAALSAPGAAWPPQGARCHVTPVAPPTEQRGTCQVCVGSKVTVFDR